VPWDDTAGEGRRPGRVGYILKMYPRFSETFVVTEMLAHERAGLEIDIFSLRIPTEGVFQECPAWVRAPVRYMYESGVRAAELWDEVARSRGLPALWEGLRLAAEDGCGAEGLDVYQAMVIARAAREREIGHLHAHFGSVATTVARLAARMAGITYSFTAHAKDIYEGSVDHGALRAKVRDAAAVVTVSDYNRDHLARVLETSPGRVRRIYNGLDLEEFSRPGAGDAHAGRAPHGPPEIIGVGRLVEKKGFDDLLRACTVLRRTGAEFRCTIVGTGPEEPALRALVESLGLGDLVRLVGARPRAEVISMVHRAAVLAAPCVVGADGNRDGLPTVLLEAMALGTPCVSTAVTGIPEVVRDGKTGLLVAERDPEALATAIRRIMTDRALGASLAGAARALIEREFDIQRNTGAMREMFAECVRAGGSTNQGERTGGTRGALA
jgi:colanic acid/amylovoran biosynthesis glycosyltransferase